MADVELSTAQGEGVGLAQLEQAGIGCSQIALAVGGLTEFLDLGNSLLIVPKAWGYVDKNAESFGGRCNIVDYHDVAEAILFYYDNPDVRREHGRLSRERIKERNAWSKLMDQLYKMISSV
jgi:glycosyltransferase involved in cell wall biosynthesis